MADDNKTVTIWGLASFPTMTAAEAYALSQKGSYPVADVASASPSIQLLVNEAQWDKFKTFATNVFLPYCVDQGNRGEKRDALDAKEVKALIEGLDGDLADQVFNTPAKAIHEKTADLAPQCVASIKVIGAKGADFDVKAIVRSEDELSVPEPDLLQFPAIRPVGATVHNLYPGCAVAVTLNLYSYHNGKHPGFSAGATTVVVKDATLPRFGGGVAVDEDEIFSDD